MNKPKPTSQHLIRFINRDAVNNFTDRNIAKLKNSRLKFDVSLVATNQKAVRAHGLVLGLYSRTLANMLADCNEIGGHRVGELNEFFGYKSTVYGRNAIIITEFLWKKLNYRGIFLVSIENSHFFPRNLSLLHISQYKQCH